MMSDEEDFKSTLRGWLSRKLDRQEVLNLRWEDKELGTFRIPWNKQGSDPNWIKEYELFKAWAIHRDSYSDDQTWAKLKSNFRSVLSKSNDFELVKKVDKQQTGNYHLYRRLTPVKAKQKARMNKKPRKQVTPPKVTPSYSVERSNNGAPRPSCSKQSTPDSSGFESSSSSFNDNDDLYESEYRNTPSCQVKESYNPKMRSHNQTNSPSFQRQQAQCSKPPYMQSSFARRPPEQLHHPQNQNLAHPQIVQQSQHQTQAPCEPEQQPRCLQKQQQKLRQTRKQQQEALQQKQQAAQQQKLLWQRQQDQLQQCQAVVQESCEQRQNIYFPQTHEQQTNYAVLQRNDPNTQHNCIESLQQGQYMIPAQQHNVQQQHHSSQYSHFSDQLQYSDFTQFSGLVDSEQADVFKTAIEEFDLQMRMDTVSPELFNEEDYKSVTPNFATEICPQQEEMNLNEFMSEDTVKTLISIPNHNGESTASTSMNPFLTNIIKSCGLDWEKLCHYKMVVKYRSTLVLQKDLNAQEECRLHYGEAFDQKLNIMYELRPVPEDFKLQAVGLEDAVGDAHVQEVLRMFDQGIVFSLANDGTLFARRLSQAHVYFFPPNEGIGSAPVKLQRKENTLLFSYKSYINALVKHKNNPNIPAPSTTVKLLVGIFPRSVESNGLVSITLSPVVIESIKQGILDPEYSSVACSSANSYDYLIRKTEKMSLGYQ